MGAQEQSLFFMEGPAQSARGAAYGLSAIPAEQDRCVSLPVEKEERCLSCLYAFSDGVGEGRRYDLPWSVTQVDDPHGRNILCIRWEHHRREMARRMHRFQRRMRGSEHQHGLGLSDALSGNDSRIITRGVLGFVRRLVFLIDHD
jgi:hypothetical protein